MRRRERTLTMSEFSTQMRSGMAKARRSTRFGWWQLKIEEGTLPTDIF
jgi:hypothetical protein